MTTNQFLPRFRYISAITNEQYAVVTFTDTHDFVVDEIVSFRVSVPFGMKEINNRKAKILEIDDTEITIDIDTTNFTPFIYPVSTYFADPICVPVGSGISFDNRYLVHTILNDAFDNIRLS